MRPAVEAEPGIDVVVIEDEQDVNRVQRLSLARAQALKASRAEGRGFVGAAMHWQAAPHRRPATRAQGR
jgi:hypothetical protein